MSTVQQIELLPFGLLGAPPSTLKSWAVDNGAPAMASGIGRPVLVGRNRDLALALTVVEVYDGGSVDVLIETAPTDDAARWRPLGAATAKAPGSVAISVPQPASSWVRARWRLTGGKGGVTAVLTGTAALTGASVVGAVNAGVTDAVDMEQYRSARLTLDTTLVTSSLDVQVETSSGASPDGLWLPRGAFNTAVSAGSSDMAAVNLMRYVRFRWVVAPAGVASFAIRGSAVFTFATPDDRREMGISHGTYPPLDDTQADEWLIKATEAMLGPYGQRYKLPLRQWSSDSKRACVDLADALAILGEGTEPESNLRPENSSYMLKYYELMGTPEKPGGWIARVGSEKEHPNGIVDSSPVEAAPSAGGLSIAVAPDDDDYPCGSRGRSWFGHFGGSP